MRTLMVVAACLGALAASPGKAGAVDLNQCKVLMVVTAPADAWCYGWTNVKRYDNQYFTIYFPRTPWADIHPISEWSYVSVVNLLASRPNQVSFKNVVDGASYNFHYVRESSIWTEAP